MVLSILSVVELILSFVVALITTDFKSLQQWCAIICVLCGVRFGEDFVLNVSALPSGFSSPSSLSQGVRYICMLCSQLLCLLLIMRVWWVWGHSSWFSFPDSFSSRLCAWVSEVGAWESAFFWSASSSLLYCDLIPCSTFLKLLTSLRQLSSHFDLLFTENVYVGSFRAFHWHSPAFMSIYSSSVLSQWYTICQDYILCLYLEFIFPFEL